MQLKWVFPVPNAARLQGTPQVHDGIMYVTNTNTVIALDAGSGARLRQFTRPAAQGLVGHAPPPGNNPSGPPAGDLAVMHTDSAPSSALDPFPGQRLRGTA